MDDDVYEAVSRLSRASGERFGRVLSELARRSLKSEPAAELGNGRRFPAFKTPVDAPLIPASRIQHIIEEEGLF